MYEEDFNKLENDYSKLIHKFLYNKYIQGYEHEDLYQECLMVLDTSNKTFDPSFKVKFITYFYINMKNRISNLITQQQRNKRPNLVFVDINSALLINTPSDEDVEQNLNDLKVFSALLTELLTYNRGDVTYKILVLGMTVNEVAEQEGVSKQRISYINKRNLAKLREFSQERGLLLGY